MWTGVLLGMTCLFSNRASVRIKHIININYCCGAICNLHRVLRKFIKTDSACVLVKRLGCFLMTDFHTKFHSLYLRG